MWIWATIRHRKLEFLSAQKKLAKVIAKMRWLSTTSHCSIYIGLFLFPKLPLCT
jgi:hypothetical protein